jgi:ABC-type transport system substrate-binding protein
MFNTLLDCDVNGKFSPELATEWKLSDDLKSLTLKIRKGVKFHDGSMLTGKVVKWNFDIMLEAGLSTYEQLESVDLIDDYTVRFNFKTYENTFLNRLASALMVSKETFDKMGEEYLQWNPVGTGPFKFVSFARDVGVKYVKFDDYWEKGKPYIDSMEFQVITDPMTRSAAFQAGAMDADSCDFTKIEYDLVQMGNKYESCISGAVCMIGDSDNPDSPFSKLKVRQALDYAVNKEAIVKARGFGWYTPIDQYCPTAHPAYIDDIPGRKYNPEKARQLLAEAGYPNGFKTKLIVDSASTDKEAVTAVQGYLSKVGIQAQLDYIDIRTYLNFRSGGWKNALLTGAYGFDANLNSSFSRYFVRDSGWCPSMLKTDEFQKYFNDSLHSASFEPALAQKMIRYLYDNALVIPIYQITRGAVLKNYVHDGAFYSKQAWPGWEPENIWLDK